MNNRALSQLNKAGNCHQLHKSVNFLHDTKNDEIELNQTSSEDKEPPINKQTENTKSEGNNHDMIGSTLSSNEYIICPQLTTEHRKSKIIILADQQGHGV